MFTLGKSSVRLYRRFYRLFVCLCAVSIVFMIFFSKFYYTNIHLQGIQTLYLKYGRHQHLPKSDVGFISASYLNNTFSHMTSFRQTKRGVIITGALPGWEARNLIKSSKQQPYTVFDQVLTREEFTDTLNVLGIFKSVCDSNNLTFMMYGGSLLGSYRHFGLIPWDDDIDVLMNVSDAVRVRMALSRVPGFSIVTPANKQWKFYNLVKYKSCCFNHAQAETEHACRCTKWPNIDIFFFRENETHIWDYVPGYSGVYCYHKNDVFPMSSQPFEEFVMPVPRMIRKVVTQSYSPELCVSRSFNHKTRQRISRVQTVLCKRLFQYYPFVFETSHGAYLIKRLKLNNTALFETISLTV